MAEQKEPYWAGKAYASFSHKDCEFFPCHPTQHPEDFNCLFCYCPLYALGSKCGGNFRYTESGIKDCSQCMVPHKRENYGYITGKFQEIVDKMAEDREKAACPPPGTQQAAPVQTAAQGPPFVCAPFTRVPGAPAGAAGPPGRRPPCPRYARSPPPERWASPPARPAGRARSRHASSP